MEFGYLIVKLFGYSAAYDLCFCSSIGISLNLPLWLIYVTSNNVYLWILTLDYPMGPKLRIKRKAKKAVHGGDVWGHMPVTDFSSNVNPLGPPKSVLEALKDGLWRINHYPDLAGRDLKKHLAEHVGVSKENIALGNGSTELIKNLCEAFVDPDDIVIIAEPTFSEYGVWCDWAGANVQRVYADSSDGFKVNIDEIVEAQANAIFLCNPNNPTGVLTEDIPLLLERTGRSTMVFLDEAYIEFTNAKSAYSLVEEYPNLVVLRSMTKFYTLPGLRLGYAVACEELIQELEGVGVPWNVNALAEVAAISALKDKEFSKASLEHLEKEKDYVHGGLKDLGLPVLPSRANFFLFNLRDFGITAADLKKKLLEKSLLIRDCASFNGLDEYYARICVGKHEDNKRLIDEMRGILA